MSAHTKGPWGIITHPKHLVIRSNRPAYQRDYVAEINWGGGEAADVRKADAARIVACVNACEGIENPAQALARVKKLILEHIEDDGMCDCGADDSPNYGEVICRLHEALAALGVKK